jgi:hypothetical protein
MTCEMKASAEGIKGRSGSKLFKEVMSAGTDFEFGFDVEGECHKTLVVNSAKQ